MVKINKRGLDDAFGEIGEKVMKVDKEIRAIHTGKPAAEVEPVARAAFARIGINFASMNDYAASVENNEPFEFRLGS